MFKKLILASAAALLSTSAFAQAPVVPVSAVKAATNPGSRVLIADIAYILVTSEAGKYRATEMNKIRAAIAKEIEPQKKLIEAEQERIGKIEDDVAAFAKTLTAQGQNPEKNGDFLKKYGDYQTQVSAFQKKANDFSIAYQYANADAKATDEASSRELLKALNPIVKSVVAAKGADILLNVTPNGVAYYVDNVDITDELLEKFNAASKTIPVTRVKVPREAPKPAAAGPSAVSPAAPAATGGALPKKPAIPVKPQ